jgi:SAM-dependent methyltransferase
LHLKKWQIKSRTSTLKYHKLILLLLCIIVIAAIYACTDNKSSVPDKHAVIKESKPVNRIIPGSSGFTALGARRTANMMGFEDTTVSPVLSKYLDFIPQAPGNLLDLGCAFGFAIEQMLAIEDKYPFLKKHHRKIIAVDMSQEHLDRVAAAKPAELVETVLMHFPNLDSPQSRKAFSPNSLGAIYAGLVLHYLSPDELTRGLKLLFDATAPGGRVFASVNSAYISPQLLEDFQRRKKDLRDEYPGWYPDLSDNTVPEKIRSTMPKSVCGIKIKFLHIFDEETLSRYFRQAGFRIIESFYFTRSKTLPMKLLGIIAQKEPIA